MNRSVKLVKPELHHKAAFIKLIADFKDEGELFYYNMYKGAEEDFAHYVQGFEDHSRGINVPEDWVSGQTFWLETSEGEIVGNIRIRDELKGAYIEQIGGHMGYDISPKFRGLGYGHKILQLGLEKAKLRGLKKVLIACEEGNTASKKIIERSGGVFESSLLFEEDQKVYLRYWITL